MRNAFSGSIYRFTGGVPPGGTATIRDDEGRTLLSYRGFASVIGIVATLIAGVVVLTGLTAAALLILEKSFVATAGALLLTLLFAALVVMLIPATSVALFQSDDEALRISQSGKGAFPRAEWSVAVAGGEVLALLRKGFASRLFTNRWTIHAPNGNLIATAAEESFSRAIARKLLGKFDRRYEADVIVSVGGQRAATIHRRPDAAGDVDVLEVESSQLDKRVAVALATLVLGSEP